MTSRKLSGITPIRGMNPGGVRLQRFNRCRSDQRRRGRQHIADHSREARPHDCRRRTVDRTRHSDQHTGERRRACAGRAVRREPLPEARPGARRTERDRPADRRHLPAGATLADRPVRGDRRPGADHDHRSPDRARSGPAGDRSVVRRGRPAQAPADRAGRPRADVGALRPGADHHAARRHPHPAGGGRCRRCGGRDGDGPRPVQRLPGGPAAVPAGAGARHRADPGPVVGQRAAQAHLVAGHLRGAGRVRRRAVRARLLRPAGDPADRPGGSRRRSGARWGRTAHWSAIVRSWFWSPSLR